MPVAKISESSMTKLIRKAEALGCTVKDYLDSLITSVDLDEEEVDDVVEADEDEDEEEDEEEEDKS